MKGELDLLASDRDISYEEYKVMVFAPFKLGPDFFRKKYKTLQSHSKNPLLIFFSKLCDLFEKRFSGAKADASKKLKYLIILISWFSNFSRK